MQLLTPLIDELNFLLSGKDLAPIKVHLLFQMTDSFFDILRLIFDFVVVFRYWIVRILSINCFRATSIRPFRSIFK